MAASLVGAIVGELPTGAVGGHRRQAARPASYNGQTIEMWAALFAGRSSRRAGDRRRHRRAAGRARDGSAAGMSWLRHPGRRLPPALLFVARWRVLPLATRQAALAKPPATIAVHSRRLGALIAGLPGLPALPSCSRMPRLAAPSWYVAAHRGRMAARLGQSAASRAPRYGRSSCSSPLHGYSPGVA